MGASKPVLILGVLVAALSIACVALLVAYINAAGSDDVRNFRIFL